MQRMHSPNSAKQKIAEHGTLQLVVYFGNVEHGNNTGHALTDAKFVAKGEALDKEMRER